jgi:hypothetical protein
LNFLVCGELDFECPKSAHTLLLNVGGITLKLGNGFFLALSSGKTVDAELAGKPSQYLKP